MKKKFIAVLLALALIAALAACGGSAPDPEAVAFETYTGIMQRISLEEEESGAFDIDFAMEMEMTFLGDTMRSFSSGNMQMIVDGDNMQMSMLAETDMRDMGMPSTVMEVFMETEGDRLVGLRMIIDGQDVSSMFPAEMLTDMVDDAINMPEFDMEAFKSVEIEEVDDGSLIHMVLDGQEIGDFVTSAMEDYMSMMDALGVEMAIDIPDILMTILVDNAGNPISMDMEMEMRMGFGDDLAAELAELEGEEMVIRMVVEYTFNGFDENVELMFV